MNATSLLAALILLAADPERPKLDHNSLVDHVPPPTGAAQLAGAWQIKGRIDYGGSPVAIAAPVCDFQQAGLTLSGTCTGPNAKGPLTGVVAGRHVSWKWTTSATTAVGTTGEAWFQGDLGDDGTVKGTWGVDVLPDLKGEFTQTRK
jgi:hypothetical protein